jgi:hypothetical protein
MKSAEAFIRERMKMAGKRDPMNLINGFETVKDGVWTLRFKSGRGWVVVQLKLDEKFRPKRK